MALFITIGYGDQAGYDQTAEDARDAAHAHDEKLKDAGVRMGRAGAPMQVRNPDGTGARARFGPFLKSDLPVAGFAVIEADSIEEAIDMVSKTPCAVTQGVVEVWPVQE
jgi:hypothetical protein